jgi:hypothetical protein
LIEKDGVHPGFKESVFQRSPGFGKTLLHELRRPVGIMDIARSFKQIEELPSLRYGAEQTVAAADAFFILVKPHRRTLGVTLGGLNRAIKIQRHPRQLFAWQPLHHQATEELPDLFSPFGIHLGKRTTGGGHIREFAQANQAQDDQVIPVIINLAQSAKSQQQVHDQQHQIPAEDRRGLQVRKAGFQPLLMLNAVIKLLEEQ